MTILGGQKMTPFLKKGGGSPKIGTPPVLGVFAGTGFWGGVPVFEGNFSSQPLVGRRCSIPDFDDFQTPGNAPLPLTS